MKKKQQYNVVVEQHAMALCGITMNNPQYTRLCGICFRSFFCQTHAKKIGPRRLPWIWVFLWLFTAVPLGRSRWTSVDIRGPHWANWGFHQWFLGNDRGMQKATLIGSGGSGRRSCSWTLWQRWSCNRLGSQSGSQRMCLVTRNPSMRFGGPLSFFQVGPDTSDLNNACCLIVTPP